MASVPKCMLMLRRLSPLLDSIGTAHIMFMHKSCFLIQKHLLITPLVCFMFRIELDFHTLTYYLLYTQLPFTWHNKIKTCLIDKKCTQRPHWPWTFYSDNQNLLSSSLTPIVCSCQIWRISVHMFPISCSQEQNVTFCTTCVWLDWKIELEVV